ncbi:MAG: hypothetical protein QHH74_02935 [Spirochaetota bacterium]|nr:hypothetical protein [Spirochaetota bacterium]
MKKTLAIIIISIICIASTIMYSKYRMSSFEPHYIGFLTVENSTIIKQVDTVLQKSNLAGIKGDKELAQCLEKQVKSLQQLSLIAITDNEYSVLIAAKKDRVINQKLFDAIITDISQKKLLPSTTFPQITRYYSNNKYYFFIYTAPQYTIVTTYSFILPKNLIIKLALENLLIVIMFIIIGTAIIITLQQKASKPTTKMEEKTEIKPQTPDPVGNLCQQFSIISVTIAQQNKKGNLKTLYSHPDKKQNLYLQPEIINELLNGVHILAEKNTVLIFYNTTTKLFFRLVKHQAFKGKTINDIERFIDNNNDVLLKFLKIKK